MSKPLTRPREKETVVIAGDSLVPSVFGTTIGRQDPRLYYVVRGFPRATVSDKIIIHVCTNKRYLKKQQNIKIHCRSIMHEFIHSNKRGFSEHNGGCLSVSALWMRNDNADLPTKVKQANPLLHNYCQMNNLPIL